MRIKPNSSEVHAGDLPDGFNLDALLHPARAFAAPRDVVQDPDMTVHEKRAILSAWASDSCAVVDAPDLRKTAAGGVVSFDDIMDALKALDHGDIVPSDEPDDPVERSGLPWWKRNRGSGGETNHGPQEW